jgi:hypothetical protein
VTSPVAISSAAYRLVVPLRPPLRHQPLVARLLGILGVLVLSPLVYVAAWVLMPNDTGGPPAGARSS